MIEYWMRWRSGEAPPGGRLTIVPNIIAEPTYIMYAVTTIVSSTVKGSPTTPRQHRLRLGRSGTRHSEQQDRAGQRCDDEVGAYDDQLTPLL